VYYMRRRYVVDSGNNNSFCAFRVAMGFIMLVVIIYRESKTVVNAR